MRPGRSRCDASHVGGIVERAVVDVNVKGRGGRACGVVVWANDEAKADAKKGGTPELVGLQLLRDFQLQKNGSWKGKVFVPDLNMNFNGTANFPDATTMKAKGCLIGGLLCKSQTWRRVDVAARATPSS